MQVSSENIRNIALVGHSDTGKTTLGSALLYTGGVVNRILKVEDHNTITDFDSEEHDREISISLGLANLPWRNHKINLIDCPGYGIFFTDTRSGMRVADASVICVSGVGGVEVNTEKCWKYARDINQPVMINVTKLDRENARFGRVVAEMKEHLGREVAPIQLPIGQEHDFTGVVDLITQQAWSFEKDGKGKGKKIDIPDDMKSSVEEQREQLIEMVAESDEELLEKFFDAGTLTDEELVEGICTAVRKRALFPVVPGSGLHQIGNSTLLDAIVNFLPSPVDRGAYPASNVGGEAIELTLGEKEPAAALVFKTINDPFSGKISLLRVVTGTLVSDTTAWNTPREHTERLGHLMTIEGKKGTPVDALVMGDIGGVAKLKDTHTGDTLGAKERPINLGWIPIRNPAISFAIEPKSKGDEEKISDAIHRLMEEDVSLRSGRDTQTGEFLLSGTGQLHIEISVAKMRTHYHVDVLIHPPKIPYRETIRRKAEGHGRHKKQSGGRGQFADCKITMEPLARGEEFDFVDEIFGGSIPQTYRPAVMKGIQETRSHGFLAGYPVVDFRVRLLDGQYHDVDSSEMAFKIAGSLGFKDAMPKAGPTILEPVMKVDIITSEEFMGDVMSDLSQRRGKPQGMETRGHTQIVTAMVPMAEMLDYAPALRSMSQGRSTFNMEFDHYDEVPRVIQIKLIEEHRREKAEEAHHH